MPARYTKRSEWHVYMRCTDIFSMRNVGLALRAIDGAWKLYGNYKQAQMHLCLETQSAKHQELNYILSLPGAYFNANCISNPQLIKYL